MVELRVRKPTGWTTVSFPESTDRIGVFSGKTSEGVLAFTLIGKVGDGPYHVETSVLDVDPSDEEKLAGSVPRMDDGTSVPMAHLSRR